ncbi:MAG: prepilin peptidase [Patescibacteria group bacterium]
MWFSFLVGLAVGSFINVLVFRLNPQRQDQVFNLLKIIKGRSYCFSCQKTLQWYELIPILSFLVQQGRCRSCQAKLSWQYPLVELITGIGFTLVYWRLVNFSGLKLVLGNWFFAYLIFWWLVIFVLIAIAIFDFKYYLIPSFLLDFLIILGIGINIFYFFQKSFFFKTGVYFSENYFYLFGQDSWLTRLLPAVALGSATIGLAYLFSRGRAMGLGDLWLVLGLGLIFGWPDILWVLILSFVFGTLVSLILIGLKRKTFKDIIPFGPFLALGAMTMFLFGAKILSVYFNLFPNLFF